MGEEPFLQELKLPHKALIAVQLAVSVFIVIVAVQMWYLAPEIMENTRSTMKPLASQPPLWLIVTMAVLALAPGVFVFNFINKNLQFLSLNNA